MNGCAAEWAACAGPAPDAGKGAGRSFHGHWIAARSRSPGAHSRDPLARNDDVDGPTRTASSAKACRRSATKKEPSMRKFIRTAVDLGKNYFQIHGLESEGGQSISRKVKRLKMREFFAEIGPCRVGMEACGSA